MLVISAEQIETFERAALLQFEDQMLTHLAQFSSALAKTLDETQRRYFIKFGIRHAAKCGFTMQGPVQLYLELITLLGGYFDSDPQYPWAAAILADRDAESEMQRANKLHEKATEYCDEVFGPAGTYAAQAFSNMASLLTQSFSLPEDDLPAALMVHIGRIYPQKMQYIGAPAMETLIHKSLEGARLQHFHSPRGKLLVTLLMLACGHGCGADPLYPWIAETVRAGEPGDPEAKLQQLENRMLTWLNQASVNLET